MNIATKRALHRGFTLIELMIVIVILGILMATVLPQFMGTRERAEDTGRKADLTQIAQALEVYSSDFGFYPGAVEIPVCLKSGDVSFDFEETFSVSFKSNKVPAPAEGEVVEFGGATCTGGYLYLPLKQSPADTTPSHYALIANVDVGTTGNAVNDNGVAYDPALPADSTPTYGADTTLEVMNTAIQAVNPDTLAQADLDDATGLSTVWIVVN